MESKPERDPDHWPPETLERLETVLRESRRQAGPAAAETFGRERREMTARELVLFWNTEATVKAMATVSPSGRPHVAPVHAAFENGAVRTTIYTNAARRRDIADNPEVGLTTWGPGGAAVILYGTASEIPGSERETRPGASGAARRTVALHIDPHRIYAMKARPSDGERD